MDIDLPLLAGDMDASIKSEHNEIRGMSFSRLRQLEAEAAAKAFTLPRSTVESALDDGASGGSVTARAEKHVNDVDKSTHAAALGAIHARSPHSPTESPRQNSAQASTRFKSPTQRINGKMVRRHEGTDALVARTSSPRALPSFRSRLYQDADDDDVIITECPRAMSPRKPRFQSVAKATAPPADASAAERPQDHIAKARERREKTRALEAAAADLVIARVAAAARQRAQKNWSLLQSTPLHQIIRLARLEANSLASRYEGTELLRALLTRGTIVDDFYCKGCPVKLLRARWLLTMAQSAPTKDPFKLQPRQAIEKVCPEAFVSELRLERLLAEVAEVHDMQRHEATRNEMAFPGVIACSHIWLTPQHPDPHAFNLYSYMLPAFEWYFSERVRRAYEQLSEARRASLTADEEEELLDKCDFGIFLDFVSLPQKELIGERDEEEEACFRCALKNLDCIYAHTGVVTLLFTQVPTAALNSSLEVYKGGIAAYHERGWPTFECGISELCKPSHHCIDMAHLLHALETAASERDMLENTLSDRPVGRKGLIRGVRVGEGRADDKSLPQLASQGSYVNSALQGALMELTRDNRRAPMSPAAFDAKLEQVTFTNGADANFVGLLYHRTATNILTNAPALRFVGLRWKRTDWTQLNAALALCERLETLVISYCESLKSPTLAALVLALPETVKQLDFEHCHQLGVLPNLARLPNLEKLVLTGCKSLHTLPDSGWEELTNLRAINLYGCEMLKKDHVVACIVQGMSAEQYEHLSLLMPDGVIYFH